MATEWAEVDDHHVVRIFISKFEPRHEKRFTYAKTKTQISFAVTGQKPEHWFSHDVAHLYLLSLWSFGASFSY